MGLPSVTISFLSAGMAAISRSQKGVVAMILRDTDESGGHALTSVTDIPPGLSAVNKAAIRRAFIGYINPPRQVLVYVLDTDDDIMEALEHFSLLSFDYLVGPPDITPEEAATVAAWVKAERENNEHLVKAVLPNIKADHEAIVNFTTDGIKVGDEAFTTEEYCGRIAGLITGTPMTYASTYATLPEVTDIDRLTKQQMDAAIDAGEYILFHDGEKVKVGRGVNSLTTTSSNKGDAFKKIKIVEVMDMIKGDIRRTAQDNYIGKYPNSYDSKCLLIVAIKGYFEALEQAGLLERDCSEVAINLEKQEAWLKKNGIDTADMTVQQIKQANTGSSVFLSGRVRILDAIEDIDIDITV